MASNHGAVAAALLLGAGLAMAAGVGPGVAGAGGAADGQMSRRPVDSFAPASGVLRVEWSVGGAEPGQSRIVGYVYNDYREDAVNVRPVGDTVRAGGRAFFDLRVAGNGPVYRVTVGPFDFMADGPWTTATTEQFLAGAGLQKMVADSPAKAAHLETLTLVAMQEHLDYDTGTWDLWAPWP